MLLTACSSDDQIEGKISHIAKEGSYGEYRLKTELGRPGNKPAAPLGKAYLIPVR